MVNFRKFFRRKRDNKKHELSPIDSLFRRFADYEAWIVASKSDPRKLPKSFPKEYLHLFGQNELAYNFYRHYLYKYIQDIRGEGDHLAELWQLWQKTSATHPIESEKFRALVHEEEPAEQYFLQQHNVYKIAENRVLIELTPEWLFAYQSMYENAAPLAFIAILCNMSCGQVFSRKLSELSDRNGRLIKGRAISYIFSNFGQYPHLKALFSQAYDARLRNTVGHNEYTIEEHEIRSLDGAIAVRAADFANSLYALQLVQFAFLWLMNMIELEEHSSELSQHGILTLLWDLQNKELTAFQLWCFSELDIKKDWLQQITIDVADSLVKTTFTGTIHTSGQTSPNIEAMIAEIRKAKQVLCHFVPIAPYVGEGEPISLPWGKFVPFGQTVAKRIVVY